MALADSYVKKEFTQDVELEEQRKEALLEEMGITRNDVDKLQAMMLSADEAVCAKAEELEKIQRHKGQKEDWEEFIDIKRRMGRVLHHSEIIRKLRSVVQSLVVAPAAQKNRVSLYVVRNFPIQEIKNYPLWARKMVYTDVPLYIGWLELGWSPEYEIDITNAANVAVAQRRGWRTLLLHLYARRAPHCKLCEHYNPRGFQAHPHPRLKGRPTSLTTERVLLEKFGHPTNGLTASHYRQVLFDFRNGTK